MPIELIVWRDAGGETNEKGWCAPEDVDDDNPIITSVGHVVKETENNVTLAMDVSDDGDNHTRGRIPKGMIVSRTVLNTPEVK